MTVFVLVRHYFVDNDLRIVSVSTERPSPTKSNFHRDEIIEKVLEGDTLGLYCK